jgi:hypothetical protein
MEVAFLGAVGVHGIENHAGSAQQVHHRHQETDIAIAESGDCLRIAGAEKV